MSICSPLRYRESEGVPDVNLPLLPALLLALEIPHGNVKQRWRGTQDFSSQRRFCSPFCRVPSSTPIAGHTNHSGGCRFAQYSGSKGALNGSGPQTVLGATCSYPQPWAASSGVEPGTAPWVPG